MQLLDFCLILLLNAGRVAAQNEASGNVCYILDGILIIYGVVLTVLYCRLKVTHHFTTSHLQILYLSPCLVSFYTRLLD
ncbi:High affinity immunoglobulin epsilon receptor subunit gamma [Anabarilius grahami]|nr:High affinity immunoglobulin epsilon receptor subunit gamma [Anabarilius grahami]